LEKGGSVDSEARVDVGGESEKGGNESQRKANKEVDNVVVKGVNRDEDHGKEEKFSLKLKGKAGVGLGRGWVAVGGTVVKK